MPFVHSFDDVTPPARFDGVAWTRVRVEESATEAGVYAEILAQAIDADPTPETPNPLDLTVTTAALEQGWYRFRFDTGADTATSPYTAAVFSPAAGTGALFATHQELADRLGITLTAAEQTRATNLLERASGLIQAEARQRIERVVGDTLTRRGSSSDRVRLPERPVEAVTSVTLDGIAVPGTDWYLDGDELVRTIGGWGHPDEPLVIVYTHGYATIPDEVKAVCLEAVVRVWVNPGAVRQEGYGSEQVQYQRSDGLLLSDAEKKTIRDSLRRGAGSVQLR